MPPPGSIIPKVLVALLFLGVLWQLSTYTSVSRSSAPIPTTLGGNSGGSWFQDAIKTHGGEDEDEEEAPPVILETHKATPSQVAAATPTPQPSAKAPAKEPDAKPKPESAPEIQPVQDFRDYNQTHISYGPTQCMPHFDNALKELAIARNASCTKHAPFHAEEVRRVAFASITTGKPEDAYQRAILSQMFHSAVHGTSTHVLCEQLSDGAWNKIAYLLNLVMNEMLKPEEERLEWMMWIDRDAIILDSCRPLSSFVPPATPEFEKVHLITNHDAGGLNAGVFMFRVSDWSISLFNTILAFRYYRPDEHLVLAEQTAMEIITKEDKWKDSVVRVPWYWFNAYPDEEDSVKKYREGLEPADLEWFRARKGDFAVHFAGDDGRSGRMPDWLDMLQKLGNVWEKTNEVKRDITQEIEAYWNSYKSGSLTPSQISGEPKQ